MKTEITITLDQARSWFRSGNKELRELALQAFRKDALVGSFRDITTFKKACEVLGFNHDAMISDVSISMAAMLKLNIIRKALNLGYDMHFAKNPMNSFLYYPYNPLVTIPEGYNYYKDELNSGILQVIGRVKALDMASLVAMLLMISIVVWVISIIRLVFANAIVMSVSLVVQQKRLPNTSESISECLSPRQNMVIWTSRL